jgi:hypothetical protein
MSDERTETEFDRVDAKFRKNSSVGIVQFLFEYWPAWIVYPETETITPLCRIVLGNDDDGSVLLDKNVFLTGLLHLTEDLLDVVAINVQRCTKISGYKIDVPGGENHVLELLDELESSIKTIRKIAKKGVFKDIEPPQPTT